MIRHTNRCTVADFEIFGRNLDSALTQLADFIDKVFNINYHSCSEDINRSVLKNSRGKKVKNKLALVINNCMACIVAALIS